MAEQGDDKQVEGAHALADAERLLEAADGDPEAARSAAATALRGLLLEWAQTPRGDGVGELLAQAAETDDTLEQFMPDATALDRGSQDGDLYERAKVFVDAARARLVNI